MSKVKFNLRDITSKNDTLIMMIFYYNGKKIRLSTGKSINPKYWNKKKNRAKELMEFPIHNSLNQFLEKKSTDINEIYTQYINDDDYIDSDVLKTKIKNCLKGILLKEKTKKMKEDKEVLLSVALEYKEKYNKCSWLKPMRKYNYYKLWQSSKDLILKSWIKELKQ